MVGAGKENVKQWKSRGVLHGSILHRLEDMDVKCVRLNRVGMQGHTNTNTMVKIPGVHELTSEL